MNPLEYLDDVRDWLDQLDARTCARRLRHRGRRVRIRRPYFLRGPEHISVEDDVRIGPFSRIEALAALRAQRFTPRVRIGEGTSIEWSFILVCVNEVTIGSRVMIATNVFVSDTTHGYADGTRPYLVQPVREGGRTSIGSGTWIGANSIIGPNVTIGEQCIVGANSLVTGDLPPFAMAVGCPARIVKRFDHDLGQWRRGGDANGS